MTEIQEKAIGKIQEAVKFNGRKQEGVSAKTKEALKLFCRQSEEFAEAVVQGGTMQECMDAAVKGTGMSPDDVEVYGKAVEFFFRGAKINLTMRIEMAGDESPALPAGSAERAEARAISRGGRPPLEHSPQGNAGNKEKPIIIDISDLL